MDTTTHGIEYPEGTDPITDYPAVAQAAAETIDAMISGGWISISAALTFGAADGHTYTVTAPADLTAAIGVGMRLRVTHAAAVKYFIVTAIAFAGGTTTITLYGGTDYALAAGAITLPAFSPYKAPLGFPLDPAKWTETMRDTSNRTQSSPTGGTIYNPGSLSLAVPIGAWRLCVTGNVECVGVSVSGNYDVGAELGLSTATNTLDTDLAGYAIGWFYSSANTPKIGGSVTKEKFVTLAAKTTYYMNACAFSPVVGATFSTLSLRGDLVPSTMRAVCAYL